MQFYESILVFYKSGEKQTTVIDVFGKSTKVEVSVNSLLESLCANNGLNLDAVFLNSRKLMKAKKNPPINLCYRSKITYFRVVSGSTGEQIWIKFSPLLKLKKQKNGQRFLAYKGNFLINVDFDHRKYQYQYNRVDAFYHNDRKCPILELLLKTLLFK